jgi:cytochrome d ubiquinol oxidase subunit II
VLGSCWLEYKTSALLHGFSVRALRIALPVFLLTFGFVVGTAFSVQPGIVAVWKDHPLLLGTVSCTVLIAALILFGSIGKRPDVRPLAAGMVMIAAGIAGLAIIVFPMVVPFRLSIWSASSSRLSQIFVLTGAIVVTPVVLGYSFFAYWVFRGKTPEKGWDG